MAVAYDNDADVTGDSVSSITTPGFTISGSDRVIIASVGFSGVTLTSVSGAGASWEAISGATADNGGKSARMWRGIAPSTGTQTVTATFANADGNVLSLTAVSYTGADQTTPAQNGTGATGAAGTDPTVTVSGTTSEDFVQDMHTHANLSAAGANQTARFGPGNYGMCSTQNGADGGVMSATRAEDLDWAIAACRIVAAAAAPSTVTWLPRTDLVSGPAYRAVVGGMIPPTTS